MAHPWNARRLVGVTAAIIFVASTTATGAQPPLSQSDADSGPQLPTPLEHYEEFDFEAAARALLPRIALRLDPVTLQRIMSAIGPDPANAASSLDAAEILELLDDIDLEPFRAPLVELLIHGSSVLELIPEEMEDWVPLVHDSLLVVLDGMAIERIGARVADQAALPRDAERGDRLLAFGAETPSFQKIGQIMARSSWLPEDLAAPLQTLESDIVTTNADELLTVVRQELGSETLDEYQFEFEDEVLSEASVGAVIGATLVMPGESERQRVVIKIIKAYAVDAIEEDLESINTLVTVLEANREFYGIGATPLVDMFQEVRTSLSREIQAADERAHLRLARDYFAADPRVIIPWVCECSSANVTVMERIEGGKVTEAYPDDEEQRRKLAVRLADVMVYDVMFASEDALFHGDPHAGNVFFVGSANDPYRIALLDWGLQGTLSFEQRVKFVQVGLGLSLKHADRLRQNMDALVSTPIDVEADAEKLDAIIERIFAKADQIRDAGGEDPGTLTLLDSLVSELATAGYVVDSNILLYVKSIYTIQTVITDLDPEFDSSDYMAGRVRSQVLKEMPKRLGNTVWIPGFWSHDYESMSSNADVWATAVNSVGLGFKAVGVGIWKGISFPFR